MEQFFTFADTDEYSLNSLNDILNDIVCRQKNGISNEDDRETAIVETSKSDLVPLLSLFWLESDSQSQLTGQETYYSDGCPKEIDTD